MMTLTLEQQLALANLVTGKEWKAHESDGYVYRVEKDGVLIWGPSIDGEDWQVAQACRVIVAAMNLTDLMEVKPLCNGGFAFCMYKTDSVDGNNILEAAALALLQGDGA